ncbi:MAG: Peptide deformylase [Pseudomonadota bacterium]
MPKKLILEPYESRILRQSLRPVSDPLSPEIQTLIADMLFSIDIAQLGRSAAGMAANQWGFDWQIFLYCPLGNDNPDNISVIINPSYAPIAGRNLEEELAYEGCFSIPNAAQKVSRYTAIAVRYQTPTAEWIEKELFGWEARVWQHENDHVLGILCDAKAERTLEKIVFNNTTEETNFWANKKASRKK